MRLLRLAAGSCVAFVSMVSMAWAQQFGAEAPVAKSWVAGYVAVVLLIAIGLAVVCRPGSRKAEFRRPETE